MSKNTYAGPKTPGKRLTTKEFIKRARKVHGNRYDYSKVVYKNYSTKVLIICPEHGEFWQVPYTHLNGANCPKCCGTIKLTTKEFIERACAVHGSKYDYSKSKYKDYHTKLIIICPIHGEFKQKPANHISGQGCPLCNGSIKLNNAEFIKEAKKVHGSKYDYSKVDYINYSTKVIIICPIHGEFKQTPHSHLSGTGCAICGISSAGVKRSLTTNEFIKLSKKVHKNKYDYSKVKYGKNNNTKVIIICPIHGEFLQRPGPHMQGQGCPECAKEKMGGQGWDRSSDPHPGYLYFLTCKLGNDYFCKIGTAYDTKKRFKSFPFEIVDSVLAPGIIGPLSMIEEKIKKDFEEFRYIPKVKFGGYKECFQISAKDQILEYIKSHVSTHPT